MLSNHDVVRHATRLGYPVGDRPARRGIGIGDPQPDAALGLRRARAATLLMLALPGSAYLYQGEELGLPEHTDAARRVPAGPDLGPLRAHRARPGRLPGADPVGGGRARRTASGRPTRSWLPQPAVWAEYALDRQRGVAGSTYELYRAALRLRREHRLGAGPTDLGGDPGGRAGVPQRRRAGADQLRAGARADSRRGVTGSLLAQRAADRRRPGARSDVTVWAR